MKNQKLKLANLTVNSFATSVKAEQENQIKGGGVSGFQCSRVLGGCTV